MADRPVQETMNRRKALRNMSLVLGAASSVPALAGLSAEAVFAQGQSIHEHVPTTPAAGPTALKVFNPHQNQTVIALSELIIPQTTTPGAKAARVNEFIDIFLSSGNVSKRQEFLEGLQWVDMRSQQLFQTLFVKATPQQQTELLTPAQRAQFHRNDQRSEFLQTDQGSDCVRLLHLKSGYRRRTEVRRMG